MFQKQNPSFFMRTGVKKQRSCRIMHDISRVLIK
jgi:hypothetical protein